MRDTVLASFFVTLMAVLAPAAFAGDGHGRLQTGEIVAEALNVRAGPGIRYHRVGVFYGGEHVRILDAARGWFRVRNRGLQGWVSARFVVPVHAHRRYRPRFAFVGPNRFGFANVFDGPGRQYRLVARLYEGERVRLIERGPRWTLVKRRGVGRGYVRSRFLVPAPRY